MMNLCLHVTEVKQYIVPQPWLWCKGKWKGKPQPAAPPADRKDHWAQGSEMGLASAHSIRLQPSSVIALFKLLGHVHWERKTALTLYCPLECLLMWLNAFQHKLPVYPWCNVQLKLSFKKSESIIHPAIWKPTMGLYYVNVSDSEESNWGSIRHWLSHLKILNLKEL